MSTLTCIIFHKPLLLAPKLLKKESARFFLKCSKHVNHLMCHLTNPHYTQIKTRTSRLSLESYASLIL